MDLLHFLNPPLDCLIFRLMLQQALSDCGKVDDDARTTLYNITKERRDGGWMDGSGGVLVPLVGKWHVDSVALLSSAGKLSGR